MVLNYSLMFLLCLQRYITVKSYNYGIRFDNYKFKVIGGTVLLVFLYTLCSITLTPHNSKLSSCNRHSLYDDNVGIFVGTIFGPIAIIIILVMYISILTSFKLWKIYFKARNSTTRVKEFVVEEDKKETNTRRVKTFKSISYAIWFINSRSKVTDIDAHKVCKQEGEGFELKTGTTEETKNTFFSESQFGNKIIIDQDPSHDGADRRVSRGQSDQQNADYLTKVHSSNETNNMTIHAKKNSLAYLAENMNTVSTNKEHSFKKRKLCQRHSYPSAKTNTPNIDNKIRPNLLIAATRCIDNIEINFPSEIQNTNRSNSQEQNNPFTIQMKDQVRQGFNDLQVNNDRISTDIGKPNWFSKKRKSWEMRAFTTSIVISLHSLILTGPMVIFYLIEVISGQQLSHQVNSILAIPFLAHALTNPFIYAWRVPEIRHELRNICRRNH
ncbi:ADOR [Mytilus edulis]|uniref:ADORA2A n=1 Tax=Mytilus edulis TaxID=6550 RepID=A0A8S3TII0_MYTED|nr:ADOR [Mytilus edulis]